MENQGSWWDPKGDLVYSVEKQGVQPPGQKVCPLPTEKLAITKHKGRNILNKRTEIVAKCRLLLKYDLSQKDSKD